MFSALNSWCMKLCYVSIYHQNTDMQKVFMLQC